MKTKITDEDIVANLENCIEYKKLDGNQDTLFYWVLYWNNKDYVLRHRYNIETSNITSKIAAPTPVEIFVQLPRYISIENEDLALIITPCRKVLKNKICNFANAFYKFLDIEKGIFTDSYIHDKLPDALIRMSLWLKKKNIQKNTKRF